MTDTYAVIMAGGRGERFWPLSTNHLPKPFIPLLGNSSLLQETVRRIQMLVPPERILISIGATHSEIARHQLPQIPDENFIIEPVGRDTAACLGFCALHIDKRNPDGIMLAIPADHYVRDESAFRDTIQSGMDNLEGATGIVFGITPVRPETGYGYILTRTEDPASGYLQVARFVEKPDAATAARYLAEGNYFWNSGMFLWRNSTLIELFKKHMPDLHEGMCTLKPHIGNNQSSGRIAEIFSGLPRISIDFGIMEKTTGLRLIPARFGWDDIGTWASLARALPQDADGNICLGSHTSLESNNCILYAGSGSIAVFGVSDLIVVEANGNVLVCPKDKASELKNLVKKLNTPE